MYEIFDHTADIGLRIHAATREQLFIDAASGFFSLLVANPQQVKPVHEREIRVSGLQNDLLLFDWLNELLYLFDTEHILLSEFHVQFDQAGLVAQCRGETFDPVRHTMEHEVKAITYHGLSVESGDDGWVAELILDI